MFSTENSQIYSFRGRKVNCVGIKVNCLSFLDLSDTCWIYRQIFTYTKTEKMLETQVSYVVKEPFNMVRSEVDF